MMNQLRTLRRRWQPAALLGALVCSLLLLSACAGKTTPPATTGGALGNGWQPTGSLPLSFAEGFAVDYYPEGLTLLTIAGESRYLVVPQGGEAPAGLAADIVVLQQPLSNIYMATTPVMCHFDALDALGQVRLSGTQTEDWYLENVKQAMETGAIAYGGKYNAPDYELILAEGCDLSIHSAMISRAPEVKEKLEELGVPVLADQSSTEPHPLGRVEWIKLYGVLTGREAEAAAIFDREAAYLDSLSDLGATGKTVAFFYINSSGQAVVRKPGDYITKMIQLAGGDYVFDSLDGEGANSVAMEMEQFYAAAKDADVLIYNSTIGGEYATLGDLTATHSLLEDFKAVQTGQVWCTGKTLYQDTTHLGLMISDIHQLLTQEGLTELNYLYKLPA